MYGPLLVCDRICFSAGIITGSLHIETGYMHVKNYCKWFHISRYLCGLKYRAVYILVLQKMVNSMDTRICGLCS